MAKLWTSESRFQYLLDVEIAVARAQARLGIIPKRAALDIQKKGRFKVEEIEEIERTTRHDVIAFVTNVASYVGPSGRYVHYGMTSSDVLDTALSLALRDSGQVLLTSLDGLIQELGRLATKYRKTWCAGRTHGMHAEVTTFGFKMAGHQAEFRRHERRIQEALRECAVAKLSGPVGTYSTQPQKVEAEVARILGLHPEVAATQVVPRDRHAQLILALSLLGSGIERLAVELRHLQRTEVGEAEEGFSRGQKGSSAMPHKKNPISAENLTGLARLLRSYAGPALENVALWHERDISHSSVERVVFPDAFILADYACDRLRSVLSGLQIFPERMRENMERSQGRLMSSQLLLALIDRGLSREDAYAKVQSLALNLKKGQHLDKVAAADPEVRELIGTKDLRKVFKGLEQLDVIESRIRTLQKYRGK